MMKRKGLSILLTICMVLAMMPSVAWADPATGVSVGGLTLDANDDPVYLINDIARGNVIEGGANAGNYNVKWENGTLTLKNATIKGDVELGGISKGIYRASGDLTIVLEGENTVTGVNGGYGVHVSDGSLTIQGSGSLTATGGSGASDSIGILCKKGITVKGNATVTAVGGTAVSSGNSYGMYCGAPSTDGSTITIQDNATVTATGGDAKSSSYGMYCGDSLTSGSSITIQDNATVIAEGGGGNQASLSYGIYVACNTTGSAEFSVSGGKVMASGGAADKSYGLGSYEKITVSGGKVTAIGGAATQQSYGLHSTNSITLSGGSVTAVGGKTGIGSYGINGDKGVSVTGAETKVTAVGGVANYTSTGIYGSSGAVNVFDGSSVTAVGGEVDSDLGNSWGIRGTGVSVSGNDTKVVAVGGKAGEGNLTSYGVYSDGAENGINYSGGLLVTKGGNNAMNKDLNNNATEGSYKATSDGGNAEGSNYYVLSPASDGTAKYHVHAGNVSNETTNVTGHLGWTGKELTLTDTIIIGGDSETGDSEALSLPADGKLVCSGFNVVLAGKASSASSAGVSCAGATEIGGTGSLTTIGGSGDESYGVNGKAGVTFSEGVAVTAIGGSGDESCGVKGEAGVTLSLGVAVTAIGGSGSESYGMAGTSVTLYSSGTAIGFSQAINIEPIISAVNVVGEYDSRILTWAEKEHDWSYSGVYYDSPIIRATDGGTKPDSPETLEIKAPTRTTYSGSGNAAAPLVAKIEGSGSGSVDQDKLKSDLKDVSVQYAKKTGENTFGTATETPPTDAGTYKAFITVQDITKFVEYTIGKKTVEAPVISSNEFTGETLTADLADTADYTVTTNVGGIDVGEYDVVLTLVDSANTKWNDSEEATKTLKFNITKGTWAKTSASGSAQYGATGTVDLAEKLAPGGVLGTIEVTGGEDYLDTPAPAVAGNLLSFKFKNDSGSVGKTVTVTVPVTGATNHADYDIIVTLTVADRSNNGGSSAKSATPVYQITDKVSKTDNGTLKTDKANAKAGDTVTITLTSDEGYRTGKVTVLDSKGNEVPTTKNADGTYSFVMPEGKVSVDAEFVEDAAVVEPPEEGEGESLYSDVKKGDWFYEPVKFVTEKGLFKGISETEFGHDLPMTREMVWTVLGREAGETMEGNNVYEDAKAWAMERKVTDGSDPSGEVTREELITILWRFAGEPAASAGSLSDYPDASQLQSFAKDPMAWAVENGIIQGSGGKLLPGSNATRAEVAAMMERFDKWMKAQEEK